MMFGKIPPQAKDIERAVLGAMLIDNNCLNVAMTKLFSDVFYMESHALIFRAIEMIYDLGNPV
ncbi:DnaB-like helicase N-terminal domain-containing protein, partial [Salmonella enterica]|uniref:DnaB-like helicase N-terminal domain-containing protein n=1 Tax=Salmonella enterica TaxID=28901 RepID=UPI003EDC7F44